MSDLIDRQEAIDALEKSKEQYFDRRVIIGKMQDIVNNLPSAQTEQNPDEWCTDCKEYDKERHCCPRFNKVIRTAMADASRWIPCSERLPDKDGRYLTTCSKIGAWEVDWDIWHCEPKPSWLWEQSIIAWMPLPEPYGPEE